MNEILESYSFWLLQSTAKLTTFHVFHSRTVSPMSVALYPTEGRDSKRSPFFAEIYVPFCFSHQIMLLYDLGVL